MEVLACASAAREPSTAFFLPASWRCCSRASPAGRDRALNILVILAPRPIEATGAPSPPHCRDCRSCRDFRPAAEAGEALNRLAVWFRRQRGRGFRHKPLYLRRVFLFEGGLIV
jgi:hypothetical protein